MQQNRPLVIQSLQVLVALSDDIRLWCFIIQKNKNDIG